MSAGISLGPYLYINHIHNVPKSIVPKCADNLVAISIGKDIGVI